MGEYVAFKVDADQAVADIYEMRARMEDLSPVMEKAGQILEEEVLRHLDNQESPRGMFVALTPKYAAWKAKHYPGKTILRASDDMRKSVSSDHTTFSAEAGPVGIAYAAVHNYGGGNNIPQREYAWIADETGQELEELTIDYIMEGVVN